MADGCTAPVNTDIDQRPQKCPQTGEEMQGSFVLGVRGTLVGNPLVSRTGNQHNNELPMVAGREN